MFKNQTTETPDSTGGEPIKEPELPVEEADEEPTEPKEESTEESDEEPTEEKPE